MTKIERKAMALVNEVHTDRKRTATSFTSFDRNVWDTHEALAKRGGRIVFEGKE